MNPFPRPGLNLTQTLTASAGLLSGAFLVGFATAPEPHALASVPTHTQTPGTLKSSPPGASTTVAARRSGPTIYHVTWGDTLWGIAHQFHITVTQLMVANGLTSDMIYANTTLIIPAVYTVRVQATLTTLAQQLALSPDALAELNPSAPKTLAPGSLLLLPPKPDTAPTHAASVPTADLSRTMPKLSPDDVRLLAHLVQAEAGDQPFEGQVAVAAVVLNRLMAPGFPKTLAQVIEQPGQFESVSNGSIYQAPSPSAWQAAESAAHGLDPTHGALYYYNPNLTSNAWIRTQPVLTTIGQQIFAR